HSPPIASMLLATSCSVYCGASPPLALHSFPTRRSSDLILCTCELVLRLIDAHQLLGTDIHHFFDRFTKRAGMPGTGSLLVAAPANFAGPFVNVHVITFRSQAHLHAVAQRFKQYGCLNSSHA